MGTYLRGGYVMEAYQAILGRTSCRNFQNREVEKEKIQRILKAGTYAPTGAGNQSPIIIAIANKQVRDRLSRMNAKIMGDANTDPFYGAPVILVVLAEKKYPTYIYDGTLVMGNMMIAATAEGLGSCWIHRAKEEFETAEGKQMLMDLGITGEYEGIGHLALGYTSENSQRRAKRKENYIFYLE